MLKDVDCWRLGHTYTVKTAIHLETIIWTTPLSWIGNQWSVYRILKHVLISILDPMFHFKHSKLFLEVIKAKGEQIPPLFPFIEVNLKLLHVGTTPEVPDS